MADGIVCLGSPKPARAGIILGIDPGMSRCGWALLAYDRHDPTAKPACLSSGVWETAHAKGESVWRRSTDMADLLQATFRDWRESLGIKIGDLMRMRAAVESPAYGSQHSSHNVSHCRGILSIMLPASGHEIRDIIDISPTELKRRVLGRGVGGKQDIRSKLPQLIDDVDWQTRWLDESDALAVAYAAWHQNADKIQSEANAPKGA